MENLNPKTVALLNERIKEEQFSSQLYKSMAVALNFYGFAGAAKLWEKYSQEELKHMEWAYEFLLDCDYLPEVPQLEKPKAFKGDLIQVINDSYLHEQKITASCKNLAHVAQEVGDCLTFTLALKYVAEQREELQKTKYWLDRIEAFGNSKEALRLLDNEMYELAE